jgi:protein-disulfide isomerase
MTPFYAAMGVIAVAGLALIGRGVLSKGQPPLTLETIAPVATGPRGVVLGSDSAPVEITEFSDFECPFCARFSVLQMPDIRSRLIETGRLRWRFVHYPLQNHAKGPLAHLAAACGNEQGRFWQMHDLIYENQDSWVFGRDSEGVLQGLARRAGLDMGRYGQCMEQRSAWGAVLNDKTLGDSVGIGGTPTFYVNGRFWQTASYSSDAVRALVDSLAPAPAAPAQGR